MAKKKATKKATKKRAAKKKVPETLEVWVPVEVGQRHGKAYAEDSDGDSCDKITEKDRKRIVRHWYFCDAAVNDASHVVWIKATVPVPQVKVLEVEADTVEAPK